MEDRRGKPRVHARQRLKQLDKIVDAARAARGDDGHLHDLAHPREHFKVEALLHAVGVDGVEHDLPRPALNAAADPFDRLHAGVFAAAPGEDAEDAVHALDVGREYDALAAVAFGSRFDQLGVADCAGVDADLVRAALEHAVKIVERVDAAAHGERNKHLFCRFGQNVGKQPSALGGGRNIIENELVRPAGAVELCQLHRRGDVAEALKVDALDHAAVLDVQAGYDALCDHFAASNTSFRLIAPV